MWVPATAAHARDLLILVERSAEPIGSYDAGGSRLLVGGAVVGERPGRELGAAGGCCSGARVRATRQWHAAG